MLLEHQIQNKKNKELSSKLGAENMAALREIFDKVRLKRRELTTEFVKRCQKGEFGSGKIGDQNFFAGHNIILKYFS